MSDFWRSSVGVVAIGRNEGERLRRCLESSSRGVRHIVYVDSGSTDGSVELAKSRGATVLDLDMSRPFTAARGRNEGIRRLRELAPEVAYVQVIDGDCELAEGFLDRALGELMANPDIAVVCGRRRERFPQASIYNRLCDMEWGAPPLGDVDSCGGDALIRLSAFQEVGGYDDQLIAGEEPDMCFRLRRAGWKIRRINAEMTLHDAQMTHAKQWWRRALRGGHATAELFHRYGGSPEHFKRREVRSVVAWGGVFPGVALTLSPITAGSTLAMLGGGYGALWYRIRRRCLERGISPSDADLYAAHCVLAKFPELLGMLKYAASRLSGRRSALIEYKGPADGSASVP